MASILIIDDEAAITSAFAMFFRQNGGHVVTEAHTGIDGVNEWRRVRPDLTLLDVRLPDMTGFEVLERLRAETPVVIMITAHGDVPMAVKALQSGAENFLTKPVDLPLLQLAAERGLEKASLRRLNRYIQESRAGSASVVMGSSPMMRDLASQIEVLAASDRTTGLILGESGTGKGAVAELIHSTSSRAAKAFVDVNCGALTADSLDSELFGVERIDDAHESRPGRIEIADGGTLFLDEIGDLDAHLQPKLIRVLEHKSFRRVGGAQEIAANVRVLAATSKDLVAEVNAQRFREDLYYRLSVMPVSLPPLRARTREDLVELVGHVLRALEPHLPGAPGGVSDEALEYLLRYSWPGNIRELRNVLERALLLGRGRDAVGPEHLPAEVRGATGAQVEHHVARSLNDIERAHIDRTLRALNFNRTHAAKELGISRATLIKKIREYQIPGRDGR
ncbi:MAG TPA: sigma-54 dependent transcriptional regulator [Gemmatimonadaceae bacterium]|nr:sigma-54 dependent transcriptional regulator [Gemmatimonadaceae bacterium]